MNRTQELSGKIGVMLLGTLLLAQSGCRLPGMRGPPPGLPHLPGLPHGQLSLPSNASMASAVMETRK